MPLQGRRTSGREWPKETAVGEPQPRERSAPQASPGAPLRAQLASSKASTYAQPRLVQLPFPRRRQRQSQHMTYTHFRRPRALGTRSPPRPAGSCSCCFPVLFSAGVARKLPNCGRKQSGSRRVGGAAMPRYYEDKPEGGACAGVKEDLGACLLQSDCVLQVAQPARALGFLLTGRRGRRRCPGRPAVSVRTHDSRVNRSGCNLQL